MKRIIIFIFVLSFLYGCSQTKSTVEEDINSNQLIPNVNRKALKRTFQPTSYLSTAITVVELLKEKDFNLLSNYIHPDKGVRFTPYGYINVESDLVFNHEEIQSIKENQTTYTWGVFDGSGEPIKLTINNYYKKFIFDLDFSNPQMIGNNRIIGKGNMTINIQDVYPQAKFVEFHFIGLDESYGGFDWRSLRIVLEQLDEKWYVVGIIHDQWTI